MGNGNPGINKLAQVLNQRMRAFHDDIENDIKIDFGHIGADWNLRPNSMPISIPNGEYKLCQTVQNTLSAGDAVLLAWVGKDVVVIDKLA